MAASIGADFVTVEPSEADLVNNIEQCVYHSEGPISSFHGPGKIILSKFVRDSGYKASRGVVLVECSNVLLRFFQVVLSGEGSDEIFGGYASLLLDYLRQPDPLAEDLNIPTPSAFERDAILHKLENTPPSQDHLSISDSSFSDAKVARSMLGGICSHRMYASMTPPGEIFPPVLLQKTGQPDGTRAVAEGFDGRVRYNAQSGHWHSLHTALVNPLFQRRFQFALTGKWFISTPCPRRNCPTSFSTKRESVRRWRTRLKEGHLSSTTSWWNMSTPCHREFSAS